MESGGVIMDPLTHSLAGATISRLGFKRKASLWVLLIASIAPDLDYISITAE